MDMKQLYARTAPRAPQRGGTILGIIIGVLVGLGAALAVAIYVTKVPVPFVNKSVSKGSSTEQDAAEAKKNKDWDPNAALYGKNPAKPNPAASGVLGSTPDATLPGATASAPADGVKPAKAASAAVASKAAATASSAGKPGTADPLGDLAKAKAAQTVAKSAVSGADPFIYSVQAGAFRTPEDAESQRAKLAMLGLDAKISEREQSGHTVYRVRVGPFNNKDDADKAKEKLDGSGFDTALVRVQR
jgi:cell division protein FtsN